MEWYYDCLVTLTDLKTRRAGLSASAELLVLLLVILKDFTRKQFAFLSRVSIPVHAERDIVMANPSVSPSVCHTLLLYLNKYTYR